MIPPYQSIDIALGLNKGVEIEPVPGYVVREAGYYDRPQCFPDNKAVSMTESAEEATEMFCYAVAHSKYPDCVTVHECWIHFQQDVYREISNRKFWTLR